MVIAVGLAGLLGSIYEEHEEVGLPTRDHSNHHDVFAGPPIRPADSLCILSLVLHSSAMLRSIHVVRRSATALYDVAPRARSLLPLALRARPTASINRITAASSPPSQWRCYATRGRPKAGKGTTSSARSKPTSAKRTPKKAAAKAKAKAKAKPRKKVPTEKQKAAAAKKKERDELKQLKEKTMMHTEPKKKPDNAWTVFYTQQQSTSGKIAERARAASAQFKVLSAAELEVRCCCNIAP